MKKFKPLLAVNATDNLEQLKYPKMASYKLDGIRCIFHSELGMISRSLKSIQNKQLQQKFAHITKISKDRGRIYDGELYAHELSFQDIIRCVMTQDFNDEKTSKKLNKEGVTGKDIQRQLDKIKFHCFDTFIEGHPESFEKRDYNIIVQRLDNFIPVKQTIINSAEEIKELFEVALEDGYEGLILRDPDSPYKFGRSTLKEEYCLKVKPFKTFDAQIIDVEQATKVDPAAEKTTNELGRSVTSKKKNDRILIEKASAFWVMYGEHSLKVSLAMTDPEKEEVWKNRNGYIGRWIEYKGMVIGAKDVPRHPIFVRFREDRE